MRLADGHAYACHTLCSVLAQQLTCTTSAAPALLPVPEELNIMIDQSRARPLTCYPFCYRLKQGAPCAFHNLPYIIKHIRIADLHVWFVGESNEE
jgi:hypothetical protein